MKDLSSGSGQPVRSIAVIGLGYVGLPTAAMFARAGFSVTGVDVDGRVVDAVNRGDVLIFEPGLPEAVREQVAGGRCLYHRRADTVSP
jgi:UDP-N-acetyl-D-mannosaminuronic acid dehydrogenase